MSDVSQKYYSPYWHLGKLRYHESFLFKSFCSNRLGFNRIFFPSCKYIMSPCTEMHVFPIVYLHDSVVRYLQKLPSVNVLREENESLSDLHNMLTDLNPLSTFLLSTLKNRDNPGLNGRELQQHCYTSIGNEIGYNKIILLKFNSQINYSNINLFQRTTLF